MARAAAFSTTAAEDSTLLATTFHARSYAFRPFRAERLSRTIFVTSVRIVATPRGYRRGCYNDGMLLREHFVDGELVADLADEADDDTDAVSITHLTHGPGQDIGPEDVTDGALVFIKGGGAVLLFVEWAEKHGLLTRGKSIREAKPSAN